MKPLLILSVVTLALTASAIVAPASAAQRALVAHAPPRLLAPLSSSPHAGVFGAGRGLHFTSPAPYQALENNNSGRCVKRLGRYANYICCGGPEHWVCTPQPSRIPGRLM